MLDSHEITKSLPPPRDDEPASLRQDIIDEIRDHIQCGVRRELLVGGSDDVQAHERVLKKFGDPHLVARRLWFQAMWSKIMTQRLAIGSLVCSMVVSITMVVMMGLLIGRMDQQQRDHQAFNVALIEKMGSLLVPPVAAVPRDPDWNHLQIKLTSGSESGPPAADVHVDVRRLPRIGEVLPKPDELDRSVPVEASGVADCGDVPPGNYRARVYTAWGEMAYSNFTVKRGIDHIERIIIPAQMPELTKVSFDVEGLKAGPKLKQLLVFRFFSHDRELAGRTWSTQGEILSDSIVLLVIDKDRRPWVGEIQKEMPAEALYIWSIPKLVVRANWTPLDSKKQFSIPANTYGLGFGRAVLNDDVAFDSPQWRRAAESATYHDLPEKFNTAEWRWQKFTAKAAEPNHWTITIPNEVLEDDTVPLPIEN